VTEAADPDAIIIFGSVIDDTLDDQVRVTVIATGFNDHNTQGSLDFGTMPAVNELPDDYSGYTPTPVVSNVGNSGGSVLDDDYIPDFLRRGF
jgi:cell division protein FtsZ